MRSEQINGAGEPLHLMGPPPRINDSVLRACVMVAAAAVWSLGVYGICVCVAGLPRLVMVRSLCLVLSTRVVDALLGKAFASMHFTVFLCACTLKAVCI